MRRIANQPNCISDSLLTLDYIKITIRNEMCTVNFFVLIAYSRVIQEKDKN